MGGGGPSHVFINTKKFQENMSCRRGGGGWVHACLQSHKGIPRNVLIGREGGGAKVKSVTTQLMNDPKEVIFCHKGTEQLTQKVVLLQSAMEHAKVAQKSHNIGSKAISEVETK